MLGMDEAIVYDTRTGATFTRSDVERLRGELARDTGLDLADMSDKGVIANYYARRLHERDPE